MHMPVAISSERLGLSLLILILIINPAWAGCATGGGFEWLSGIEIGSDTQTPVGFERPNMNVPTANMDMPSAGSKVSPNNTSNASTDTSVAATPVAKDPPSIAGRWAMNLSDGSVRELELMLYSAGSVVYGKGNLNQEGLVVPVTTRGTLAEETLRLDVISAVDGVLYTEENLYRLALQVGNGTMNGTYQSYRVTGPEGQGEATGRRIA